MARNTSRLISALVAALLLWWFLRSVDLAAVGYRLARLQGGYLIAATALSLGTMVYRAWRWRYLVAPLGFASMRSLVSSVFMGWAVTAVLPGRLGEMARPVLLGRREGLGKMAVFGTVVLERLLDMTLVLLMLAAYLTFFPFAFASSDETTMTIIALRTGGWLLLAGLAVGAAVVAVAARLSPSSRSRLHTVISKLPGQAGRRGWDLTRSFLAGMSAPLSSEVPGLSRGRLRTLVVLHTLVLWTGSCGVHLLLFRAFRLDLPPYAVFPLISMVVVGLMVPLPAAVGSYHGAVLIGMTTLLGLSPDLAAGYAIVSHAVAFVPSTSIGLVLLAREGLTPSLAAARPD